MTTVREVSRWLEQFAPSVLAEEWDNVGLLIGRWDADCPRIMTCLTLTPESVAEAVERKAALVVTHHPLPFRAIKTITDHTTGGRMLLDLISAGIAVYSPHTAFDSAALGINQQWAELLQLSDVRPLAPLVEQPEVGGGRIGKLPSVTTPDQLAKRLVQHFRLPGAHIVANGDRPVETMAVACGAAGSYLGPAVAAGADLLLTGETNFHTCLEARASDVALVLVGHFASERFAVDALAKQLQDPFPNCEIWASSQECDPVDWISNHDSTP